MLAISVPAVPPTVTLTVYPLSDDHLQIIASATQIQTVVKPKCVLQSTTDFITWTALSTNTFVFCLTETNYMATNIVQMSNTMTFYRVEAVTP
jgi:hypothetical protein